MGASEPGEVGNCGAVEPSQLQDLSCRELVRTSPSLGYQRLQLIPVNLALAGKCAYLHAYLMDTDRIEISTPEGLNLEMTLAGLGSRAAAAIVDTLIMVALALPILLPFRDGGGVVIDIILIALPFLLFFGYHIVFETTGRRQSPGKRLMGLRIVKSDGGPTSTVDSLIRNLVRLVDFLPALYLIGIITLFFTSRNQRLGDLAAGVVVVSEPKTLPSTDTSMPSFFNMPDGWDVSAVTDEEITVARQFLHRRHELESSARQEIAFRIAKTLEAKVSRPNQLLTSERIIETVVEVKTNRG